MNGRRVMKALLLIIDDGRGILTSIIMIILFEWWRNEVTGWNGERLGGGFLSWA